MSDIEVVRQENAQLRAALAMVRQAFEFGDGRTAVCRVRSIFRKLDEAARNVGVFKMADEVLIQRVESLEERVARLEDM